MDALSASTNTTAPSGAATTTTTTAATSTGGGAPTKFPAVGSCTSGGGAVGAANGGALASAGSSLASALGRLVAAIDELRRTIEAFAQSIQRGGVAGGGGAAGSPVQQTPTQSVYQGSIVSPVQGGGPIGAATSRTSAIPDLLPGQSEQLRMARGQVTYREIPVTGSANGTTVQVPTAPAGMQVELYALRDHVQGAHRTQVLEPVPAGGLTVAAGQTVKLVARVTAQTPGDHTLDVAGARMSVHVGTQAIDALPMMTWINENEAKQRGAGAQQVSAVLSHFGVAATGNSGITMSSAANRSPVQYFSAAYEAANRTDPAEAARRIIQAEATAKAANPNAKFWVQVSDEQDQTAAQAQGTASWITQLRQHLNAQGSGAKLFVAAQARPHNLVYASVVDGWANTQSSAGRDRDSAIASIKQAGAQYGRQIELMEYPGNAFFDGQTAGSAAVSTASAALDGASSWFVYSANNLSTLERGTGDEGRGDIGGLIAIDGGRVLPTLALIEAEMGANVGAAARALGAAGSSSAQQTTQLARQLDAYRHTGVMLDLRAFEREIGQWVR